MRDRHLALEQAAVELRRSGRWGVRPLAWAAEDKEWEAKVEILEGIIDGEDDNICFL